MNSFEDRSITLGHPSYVWRAGQERRLALVRSYLPIENKRILDIGCGLGTYVKRFLDFSPHVYGLDVDEERLKIGAATLSNLALAKSETLPFRDNSFDITFMNEVLEHVQDDAQTIREVLRVTRPGGHIIIFVPNRMYFFETHGFYLGNRYIFKLLPFVNWFPDIIRNKFVPHARAYLWRDLRRLFRGTNSKVVVHTYV
ncbi:MAG: class I SAM-dependent methyltransferase, partial [Dehalococcoidia bacterium]|nr:class I SAM-dependent methyltransferase [Dehalococcoidia bacterium]